MRPFLALLAALVLGGAGWGQAAGGQVEDRWYAELRSTGLPREVVAVLPVETRPAGFGFSQRVLFVFVYIDERAAESRTRWRDVLVDYVDRNAVLVWAYSQMPFAPRVRFEPLSLWFSQGEVEFHPAPEDFVPLDGDFLAGEILYGVPAAAIVLLGEGFTDTAPITVHYGDIAEAVIPLVSGTQAP